MTVKISNLPAATSVGSGDVIPVVQSGTTKKIDLNANWSFGGDVNFDSGTLFVDASTNNVGIGTTAPTQPLTVQATSAADGIAILGRSGANASRIDFQNNANSSRLFTVASSDIAVDLYADANIPMIFSTNATERMRIDSSGNVLIGTTSTILAGKFASIAGASENSGVFQTTASASTYTAIAGARNGNSGNVAEWWYDLSTQVGTISVTASSTSYNTSSDYRLKENISDAYEAGAKVDAIKVRQFDWKADGSHQDYGMIAQELLTVAPEAVSGDPESDEMMGIDYSKLVPMLVKEIQSLRARVHALESQ